MLAAQLTQTAFVVAVQASSRWPAAQAGVAQAEQAAAPGAEKKPSGHGTHALSPFAPA